MERRVKKRKNGGTDQANHEAWENTNLKLTPAIADTIAQKVFKKAVTLLQRQLPQAPMEANLPQNPGNTIRLDIALPTADSRM